MEPWRDQLRKGALTKGASPTEIGQVIQLIESMLKYEGRASAVELLAHPYFATDIDFHLEGNFSSSDTVQIFTLSDLQKGPAATPTLLIQNPTKHRYCFHIPHDQEYRIVVTRDNQQIYSEQWTIEKNEKVLLELPLPAQPAVKTPVDRSMKNRKRLFYGEDNSVNGEPHS